MARDSENYRLWEHDVEPPKKSEQTVIVKVTPDTAPPVRMPASSTSAAGRVAHAAGVTPDSGLARLLDNGRISSIENIFAENPGGETRAPSMFLAAGGSH